MSPVADRRRKRNRRIAALVKRGEKFAAIAARFNLSKKSVGDIARAAGIRPVRGRRAATFRSALPYPIVAPVSVPWSSIAPGGRMFVPGRTVYQVSGAAAKAGARLGRRFACRKRRGGVIVVRLY